MLDRGANIHAKNDEALCLASENNHLEIVKLLIDRGAKYTNVSQKKIEFFCPINLTI